MNLCRLLFLWAAGTSTHSLDFKKSAGAFIHGFRYTGTQVVVDYIDYYVVCRWSVCSVGNVPVRATMYYVHIKLHTFSFQSLVHLFNHSSTHPSICLSSVHPFIHLSIYPFIHPFILSIFSICPSIRKSPPRKERNHRRIGFARHFFRSVYFPK